MEISPEQAWFVAMASDESDTWDLSSQDRDALKWGIDQIKSLQDELDALRKVSPQSAIASVSEAACSTEMKAEPEGIPFMITNKMRKQLGELGYSLEDVQAMTPPDAHAALQNAGNKRTKEAESDAVPPVEGGRTGEKRTRVRKSI